MLVYTHFTKRSADSSMPSYAEMDKSEKNKISHRGLALAKLQAWFKEHPQGV